MPDTVLIGRFLDGDEAAFRALYRRHTPRLRMVVLRLLAHREADADDVVQETWLAGCRSLHSYRGEARFGTWLTTIGIRAAARRLELGDEPPSDDAIVAIEAAPPLGERIDLERALAMLPDHQRAVIVLHDVEGFTHEEIARQLGVATGTSKGTLSRARAAMRRLLTGTQMKLGVTHG
jgi:RNA polymerase sigma-70 factor, ECF subfamily